MSARGCWPLVCAAVVAGVLVAALPAAASVHIEPARFILIADPGERATDVIYVTNNSDRTIELLAVLYDWSLDEDNRMVNYAPGTLRESLDGLIRFNPRSFLLGPGEKQLVRFTVTVPEGDNEPFERRGIIFFEHEDPFEGEGIGATVRTMIGTTVYVRPSVYELSFNILGALVHVAEGGDYWGAMLVHNEAVAHVRYKVAYRVLTARNAVLEEGVVSERVILPDAVQPVLFPLLGNYPPGRYTLHLTIDFFDTPDSFVHSVPFEVEERE